MLLDLSNRVTYFSLTFTSHWAPTSATERRRRLEQRDLPSKTPGLLPWRGIGDILGSGPRLATGPPCDFSPSSLTFLGRSCMTSLPLGLSYVFLKTSCYLGVFVIGVFWPDQREVCRFAVEYRTNGMLYHEPALGKPRLPSLQERRVIPIQAGDPLPPRLWDNHGVVTMISYAT